MVSKPSSQASGQIESTATSSTAFRASSSTTPVVPERDAMTDQIASRCPSTSLPEVLNVQEVSDGDPSLPLHDSLEDMVMVQRTGSENDLNGYAVLDSGATETVGSLPALEALMLARFQQTGQIERVTVTSTPMKRFKFGNGSQDLSASHVLIPVMLGQQAVPMRVYTLDVSGVPLLVGIKTLRRLRAVIDCHRDVLVLGAVDPNRGVQLKRSSSGHLLLDLRQDLLVHSFSLFQPRSRQPRSEVASGEETAFMVEPSDATPQNPSDADLLVGETVANAIHQVPQYAVVRDENELEQPCVPEAGESCEAVLHDDALRLEIETEDLMNPNRILIALLALNGGVTSSEDCIPGEPHYHSDDPRRGSIRRSLLNFGGSDQEQAEEAGDQVCSLGLGSNYRGGSPRSSLLRSPLSRRTQTGRDVQGESVRIESVRQMGGMRGVQSATELHPSSRLPRSNSISGSASLRCEDCPERGVAEPRVAEGQGHWMGSSGEERGSKSSENQADPHGPSGFLSRCCSQTKGHEQEPEGLLSGNHGPSDHSRLRAGSVSDLHSGFSGVDRPRAERPGGAEIHSRTEGHPKERGSGGGLGVCAETARSAVSYSILEDEKEIEFQAGQLLEAQNYTIVGIESLLRNMKSARLPTTRSFMEKKAREAFTLNLGLYAHGSQAGVMNATFQLPNLCRYLNRWLQEWAPSAARWTTISLIFNMESKPHRDLHNLKEQPNYLITFGEHDQGELWLECEPVGGDGVATQKRRKPNGSFANGYLRLPPSASTPSCQLPSGPMACYYALERKPHRVGCFHCPFIPRHRPTSTTTANQLRISPLALYLLDYNFYFGGF